MKLVEKITEKCYLVSSSYHFPMSTQPFCYTYTKCKHYMMLNICGMSSRVIHFNFSSAFLSYTISYTIKNNYIKSGVRKVKQIHQHFCKFFRQWNSVKEPQSLSWEVFWSNPNMSKILHIWFFEIGIHHGHHCREHN